MENFAEFEKAARKLDFVIFHPESREEEEVSDYYSITEKEESGKLTLTSLAGGERKITLEDFKNNTNWYFLKNPLNWNI